ncbi:hypothetical protein CGCA056_v010399 [Colletotrichum aenigma]|uniref:uncharacterized protein n=1 Tax=Colletotrichum aenigma TaxID=1215731 RepID=UPI001872C9B5|nr:uncharacterized protein CGCA056_v010399 [Colletotrichum aenigma]KAF5517749.1 hypothetical protein CGCA056_v010399 [Colletotrichum aenigma]
MKISIFSALLVLSLTGNAMGACRTRTRRCSPQLVCDAILKPGAFPCATKEQPDPQCTQVVGDGYTAVQV